jgi:hypothetical protein
LVPSFPKRVSVADYGSVVVLERGRLSLGESWVAPISRDGKKAIPLPRAVLENLLPMKEILESLKAKATQIPCRAPPFKAAHIFSHYHPTMARTTISTILSQNPLWST